MSLPSSRFYGRRKGRPLHKRKSQLLADNLARFAITLPAQKSLDPKTLFDVQPDHIFLEIGFGGGEHLAAQAARNPSTGFLGCEPFLNGIASLLDHIDRNEIKNVRIFPDDARHVLDALPDASIARCFVLFADPWPKARHAERRFIGPENIPRLARVLKSGAELRLATDDMNLANWMHDHMTAAQEFTVIYDQRDPPPDWIATRYEGKALLDGRTPRYFSFQRG